MLKFRYQALKAYFRGLIVCPEHVIIVAYCLDFRGLIFLFLGLFVTKHNEYFPLSCTVIIIIVSVKTLTLSWNNSFILFVHEYSRRLCPPLYSMWMLTTPRQWCTSARWPQSGGGSFVKMWSLISCVTVDKDITKWTSPCWRRYTLFPEPVTYRRTISVYWIVERLSTICDRLWEKGTIVMAHDQFVKF